MTAKGKPVTPIDVPGTYNVRTVACGPVEPGLLFRSAMLDDLTLDGLDVLRAQRIHTVVDLRDDSEKRTPVAAGPWSVVAVPLYDPRTGPPSHGDLDTVYSILLRTRGEVLVEALRAIAGAAGPVLVHCTAGKDRTGLVVALALAAVGVSDSDIARDYGLSGPQVRPRREQQARALLDGADLDADRYRQGLELHLDSPPEVLVRALSSVRDEYGSIVEYLRQHGFSGSDLADLHARLCGGADLRVLHVSDVHATTGGDLYRRIDGTDRLRQVTATAAQWPAGPDAVVLTGDLCQAGHSDAYPALAAAVADMEAHLGCPVLAVPGNHDHPELFAAAFGPVRELSVRGYRIIRLDTGTGLLSDDELERLESALTRPAPRGTIVAMHHPPIPAAAAALVGRELTNRRRLAEVVAGSDVRLILAGHFHHPMSGLFGEIPVWVGGSLAYLQHTGVDANTVVGLDAPSFSVVRIDDIGVSCVPVPLAEPDVLFRSAPTATAGTVPEPSALSV